MSRLSLELLWDCVLGVLKLLKEVWCDGEVIAASELSDLTDGTERGAHNNGLVAKLFVVVVDGLDGRNTWVLLLGILLLGRGLVPIKNATDEWGNEEGVGLGAGDGLDWREHQGQVAVDAVLFLQDAHGLDTLPGGGDLDQDTIFGDADGLVELDDVESLVHGSLGVEGKASVDLGGNPAWDDLEDLLAELNEKAVESGINLVVDGSAVLLAVLDGDINEWSILLLLGGGEDEGWVGGGVLWLVLGDGCKVAGVRDDNLLELLVNQFDHVAFRMG